MALDDDFDDELVLPDDDLMDDETPSDLAGGDLDVVEVVEADIVIEAPAARRVAKAAPAAAPKKVSAPQARSAGRRAKPSPRVRARSAKPRRAKKAVKKAAAKRGSKRPARPARKSSRTRRKK